MRYKEFIQWCEDRNSDGLIEKEAQNACNRILYMINLYGEHKREGEWKKFESSVLENIVKPTNKLRERC